MTGRDREALLTGGSPRCSPDAIIDTLAEAGIAEPVAALVPLMTIKG